MPLCILFVRSYFTERAVFSPEIEGRSFIFLTEIFIALFMAEAFQGGELSPSTKDSSQGHIMNRVALSVACTCLRFVLARRGR